MTALIIDKVASSSDIYWDIRQRLIFAHYVPGSKLKPEELRLAYGCAASTVREVLFRLSCDKLIDFEEHKGFRVPQASEQMCNEAIEIRIMIECEGASLSIAKGGLEWEAKLTAAHHKLAHVEGKFSDAQNDRDLFDIWCKCEWEFHETLVSGCGSTLLREQHRDIYDLHRIHMIGLSGGTGFRQDNIAEHRAIIEAAIERDVSVCREKIANHLHKYG
ncbi:MULTISPECIES: GntR family transcriptional regulator [unclassified Lentilitoribacter]|uniref:GntR family transcriptional regulator n=1 Tax=unclassified Lentilitoribacter TaxID=2647570 RepID=UPI0013A68E2C|nr:GntR family transcriptional regulator [Lentilitoribacter sp. Alg239-R112]